MSARPHRQLLRARYPFEGSVALINTQAFWISALLLGIGHWIVARDPSKNHGIVLLAAIGKTYVFVEWAWHYAMGSMTAFALLGRVGDLMFAALLTVFLWKASLPTAGCSPYLTKASTIAPSQVDPAKGSFSVCPKSRWAHAVPYATVFQIRLMIGPTMKLLSILTTLCLFACAQVPVAPILWDSARQDGSVLVGVVTHPDGHALEGIRVTPCGGIATRFPGKSTHTDAEGRYRIEMIPGTLMRSAPDEEWKHYVGVYVGSVRADLNPPEYLPWKDVYVDRQPGVVQHLDFVFDPMSVAPENRAE